MLKNFFKKSKTDNKSELDRKEIKTQKIIWASGDGGGGSAGSKGDFKNTTSKIKWASGNGGGGGSAGSKGTFKADVQNNRGTNKNEDLIKQEKRIDDENLKIKWISAAGGGSGGSAGSKGSFI